MVDRHTYSLQLVCNHGSKRIAKSRVTSVSSPLCGITCIRCRESIRQGSQRPKQVCVVSVCTVWHVNDVWMEVGTIEPFDGRSRKTESGHQTETGIMKEECAVGGKTKIKKEALDSTRILLEFYSRQNTSLEKEVLLVSVNSGLPYAPRPVPLPLVRGLGIMTSFGWAFLHSTCDHMSKRRH